MDLANTLLALEEGFWKSDADFYRQHLTDDAEMLLPAPAGILNKAQTVETIVSSPRWTRVRFSDVHLRRLSDDVAVLIYRGTADRNGGEAPYDTLASSTYVRRDASWTLALHQQTPM